MRHDAEIIDTISRIIADYKDRSGSIPIDELIEIADQLVCNCYTLAESVNSARGDKIGWNVQRVKDEMKCWHQNETFNVTKAQQIARASVVDSGVYERAKDAEEYFESMENRLKHADQVYQQMRSRVSYLKKEKSNTGNDQY